jgi:hypothetical protein
VVEGGDLTVFLGDAFFRDEDAFAAFFEPLGVGVDRALAAEDVVETGDVVDTISLEAGAAWTDATADPLAGEAAATDINSFSSSSSSSASATGIGAFSSYSSASWLSMSTEALVEVRWAWRGGSLAFAALVAGVRRFEDLPTFDAAVVGRTLPFATGCSALVEDLASTASCSAGGFGCVVVELIVLDEPDTTACRVGVVNEGARRRSGGTGIVFIAASGITVTVAHHRHHMEIKDKIDHSKSAILTWFGNPLRNRRRCPGKIAQAEHWGDNGSLSHDGYRHVRRWVLSVLWNGARCSQGVI